MAYTPLSDDLNIVQKLDDEPNGAGGLTAAELKAKFDEAANLIKKYINTILIPGLPEIADSLVAEDTAVPSVAAVNNALINSGNLPAGGSKGQALIKTDDTDYSVGWGVSTINRNFFSNWYFKNAVNQRGKANYTVSTPAAYTIDRWMLSNGTLYTEGNLTGTINISPASGLTAEFSQYLDDGIIVAGATITVSILLDQDVYSATFTIDETTGGSATLTDGITAFWEKITDHYRIGFRITSGKDIRACKLEYGEISTLSTNDFESYCTMLNDCLRFFYRLTPNSTYSLYLGGSAAYSTSSMFVTTCMPALMRSLPSVTTNDLTRIKYSENSASNGYSAMSLRGQSASTGYSMRTLIIDGEFTAGKYYNVYILDGGHIDFDAEITS